MGHRAVGTRWRGSSEQDLLVLTDGRRQGRHGLTLPFRDASVAELDGPGPPEISGTFDTIVIEQDDLRMDELSTAAAVARGSLRPHGHLVVALGTVDPDDTTGGGAALAWLDALRWCGVVLLGGLPCAVMSTSDPADGAPPIETSARFTAAAHAVRTLGATPRYDHAELARQLEARHRSEQALLNLLDLTVAAAERDRQQVENLRGKERALQEQLADARRQLAAHRGREQALRDQLADPAARHLTALALVKAVLRRYRVGRVALRVARYGRGLVRRMGRRSAGGG